MKFKQLVKLICLLGLAGPLNLQAADISDSREQALLYLLKHDCGSCHGMTLKGGLGPDLNPERLRKLPRSFLLDAIINGRPGTPMPPWKPLLSEAESNWLLDQLLEGVDHE